MTETLKAREAEISRLLIAEPVDLKALRKISRLEGGFLTNQIRARVWPKLLNVNRFDIPDYRSFIDPHRDDTQVSVDVERSLWRIDKTQNWREAYREDRRKALCDIIMAILCRSSDIYYYQGFHDIVSVFLLVVEDDHVAFALSEVISRDYISDFMNCDFEVVGKAMKMLYVIIKASDTALYRFLTEAGAEPYFATSWLLTWFSHDLPLISDAARIFDALLCSHPLFCYYICAAYVIHLRAEIMAAECDFSAVHDVVVRAIREFGFPTEKVIAQADVLFARTPPEVLKKLCDPDLQKLIYYNQIAAMCRPHVFLDSATSDWTLLKSQRYAPLSPTIPTSSTSNHPTGRHKHNTKSTHSTTATSTSSTTYMSSRNNFYLEHNYVDLMNYLGYTTAAYNVVDAAILATNKSKTQHSTHNNHNKTQEDNIVTRNKTQNRHKGENNKHDVGARGLYMNNRAILAAALFAGGVVSYGLFFGR